MVVEGNDKEKTERNWNNKNNFSTCTVEGNDKEKN
jgi:hypothetical protein